MKETLARVTGQEKEINMIAIVDYDAGNLKSVEKAFSALGEDIKVTRDREEILSADGIVLPGVGSFGDAMNKLYEYGLVSVFQEAAARDIPLLGICLGLQLFFESSEESPGIQGLNLLPGQVKLIPRETADGQMLKIPHMGWNSLKINPNSRLFKGIPEESYVYFVHSYYLEAAEERDVAASTEYGVHIHAAVEHGNLFACQFHPEKSSSVGLQILKNFIDIVHDSVD